MESLKRYKKELTLDQLLCSREKIILNAKDLYEEALLLYDRKKYARSYFLLCIANEELGKMLIVTSAMIDLIEQTINWSKFWKQLRNHKFKTETIEQLENFFVNNEKHYQSPIKIAKMIPNLEELKMMSLYSDMYQVDFFTPSEIIDTKLVYHYLSLTKNRIDYFTIDLNLDSAIKKVKKEDILAFKEKFFNTAKHKNNNSKE